MGENKNPKLFEVLGLDFLMKEDGKVILLEINGSPAMDLTWKNLPEYAANHYANMVDQMLFDILEFPLVSERVQYPEEEKGTWEHIWTYDYHNCTEEEIVENILSEFGG